MFYAHNRSESCNIAQASMNEAYTQGVASFVKALSGISKTVMTVSKLLFSSYKEMKDVKFSELKTGDVRVVPRCVENALGENLIQHLCKPEEQCSGNAVSNRVLDIFNSLLENVDRKGLGLSVIIKRDPEVNLFTLPGGKIILTTGLLREIMNQSKRPASPLSSGVSPANQIDLNVFDQKLAAVLAQAIASSIDSHNVKSAQTQMLLDGFSAVSRVALPHLIPQPADPASKAKHKQLIDAMLGAINVGGKIYAHRLNQAQEGQYQKNGAQLAQNAGFHIGENEIQDIYEKLFPEKKAKEDEIIRQEIAQMIPSLIRLAV